MTEALTFFLYLKGDDNNMYDVKDWNKIVVFFGDNIGKRVKITVTNGDVFDGLTDGYGEEEDSNGETVPAIWTKNRIFTREMVKKIEFLD